MIPKKPLSLTTETLSPAKLNTGFNTLYQDLVASTSKRYCHSSFELDFTGLTNLSGVESFKFYVKPPFAWEVESVELVCYPATAGAPTLVTLSSSLTGWVNLSVIPLTGVSKALDSDNFSASGLAAVEKIFTLGVTAPGAYTLGRCYAIITIKTDRGNAGTTYSSLALSDATRFAAGDSVAVAKVNTAFTTYETAVVANTACDKQLRMQIFSLRNIAVTLETSDRDLRVPSSAARFHSYDIINNGAAGNGLTITILNESAVSVSATTVNGGVTTQSVSAAFTQTLNTPTTTTADYILRFTRSGAAAISFGYVVVYYT